jgi:holo-[acyl-carrier protein] synthase
MILGIGIDIIEIERIAKLAATNAFADRILTAREKELLPKEERRRAEYLAGRFAAKEAASKALGTGIGKSVSFQDMEIAAEASGKPRLYIHADVISRVFPDAPNVSCHVSISHSLQYAVAQVIIEQV